MSAVAFSWWVEKHGMGPLAASRSLGIKAPTLSNWRRAWKENRLVHKPLGPRIEEVDPYLRDVLMTVFYLVGPGIGIPTLRDLFPDLKRAELDDLLKRYRRLHARKNRVCLHLLRWRKPGTIWAMDFCKPDQPVDGVYPYVFLVRDLASGNMLLAQPVPSRELKHVVDALRVLLETYGAPLVLKSDNEFDTQFVSRFGDDPDAGARVLLAQLLDHYAVVHLLSPPYFPRYNGAIEAGIGAFKTRAHLEAARHGHPLEWNCNDVESARMQANAESRPWGFNTDTPEIAWAERTTIAPLERLAFRTSVERIDQELQLEKKPELLAGMPFSPKDLRSFRRTAVCRALVQHGFLLVRRKRFTLPFKRRIA